MYPQVYVQLIFSTASIPPVLCFTALQEVFFPPVLKQLPADEQKCNFIK